jgi:hypothetical protein
MGMPGLTTPTVGAPGTTGAGTSWVMVPRCTLRFEKCQGGVKIHCDCDDKMACGMLQNLCTMLAGGMCSCCCTLNGMTVCTCNYTMALCKCDMTEKGVCLTCTSGDDKCCQMIQAQCDCLSSLLQSGCTCCVMLNNTPICCGCSDSSSSTKPGQKK